MKRRNHISGNNCGCNNNRMGQAFGDIEGQGFEQYEGEEPEVTGDEITEEEAGMTGEPATNGKAIGIVGALVTTGVMIGMFQLVWNMRGKKIKRYAA